MLNFFLNIEMLISQSTFSGVFRDANDHFFNVCDLLKHA